jgi:hypothetical protein
MHRGLCIALVVVLLALAAAIPATASVVVNEIMYNSSFSPDVEYIELYNTGPAAQNLGDWYLLDSDPAHNPLQRCYLSGTLGVGQYLVVAADTATFHGRFPGLVNLNPKGFDPGGLGFGLGNSSDAVKLYDDDDVLRDSVTYQDRGAWPTAADGHGSSLELINPFLDNTLASSWAASTPVGGTPGVVNSMYAANAAPICRNGARNVDLPTSADAVTVTVYASDAEALPASVALWVDAGSGYASTAMLDDGLHGDGAAGDSVYGAVIPAHGNGTLVRYYAVATDAIGQMEAWPTDAPADYRAYTVGYAPPVLVVNEVVASNVTGATDELGEHEDWVEIHNPGASAVDLGGMYLTDELGNGNKGEIPAGVSIPAGGYLVFWLDDSLSQGPRHMPFKLTAAGEEIGIFGARDLGNTRIHGFKFGPVAPDVAIGFKPDYDGHTASNTIHAPDYLATPTPGASNATSAYYSPVCINEFHTTSAGGGVDDWVELYNRSASPVSIAGNFLSDNRTSNLKYRIPDGTTIAGHGFYVVNEVTLGFSFSSSGEVIVLTAPDSVSGLDFHDFTQQSPDVSEGRFPDGLGVWGRFATPTPGSANVSPIAILEPTLGSARGLVGRLSAAPNPSRARAEIRFALAGRDVVTAAVYDALGRRVRTLQHAALEAGDHIIRWNGDNDRGARVSAGAYFVRVSTPSSMKSLKVLMLK